MRNTEEIWRLVDAQQDDFIALSDRVWEMPELCYTEFRSCAEHTAMLEAKGFRLTKEVAGIPTAVMGEAGEDGPVIAILGEYDALPGLSQQAGVAEQKPMPGPGFGHGCGHNLLGSASMLAAAALKDYLAANGMKGRVRYYGCPAEEGGAAKGFMARAGAFSDVDVAISWHPSSFSGVNPAISLANTRIDFAFHGRASHAAASPHLGRSALDAVELMSVGVSPKFTPSLLHIDNRAVGGAVVFAMLAASAFAQLGARHRSTRQQLLSGAACLASGLAVLLVGVAAGTLAPFLIGIAIAGVGQGLAYLGGQGLLDALVPADRRGGVMSAFFLVLYLATAASALAVGLASGPFGLKTATVAVTAVLIGLASVSLLVTFLRVHR